MCHIKILVVGSGFEPDKLTELVRVTPLCIALLVLAEFLITCFRCRAMKNNFFNNKSEISTGEIKSGEY